MREHPKGTLQRAEREGRHTRTQILSEQQAEGGDSPHWIIKQNLLCVYTSSGQGHTTRGDTHAIDTNHAMQRASVLQQNVVFKTQFLELLWPISKGLIYLMKDVGKIGAISCNYSSWDVEGEGRKFLRMAVYVFFSGSSFRHTARIFWPLFVAFYRRRRHGPREMAKQARAEQ